MTRLVLAVLLLLTPGCGTLIARDLTVRRVPFAGVTLDAGFVGEAFGGPLHGEEWIEVPALVVAALVDLPLSFTCDLVLLPFDAASGGLR